MRVAGTEYTLHQWANDWISADGPSGPAVFSPRQVHLNPEEISRMRESEGDAIMMRVDGRTPSTGFFWERYRLTDKGYFELVQFPRAR